MKTHNSLSAGILKAMSIFGGVQVISILCSIVRTKLVAVWIGAAGVGLFAIYNSTIEMISAFTRFELRSSSVRDISSAAPSRLVVITTAVRRWSWLLGMFGAILIIGLSPWLSQWSFGDDNHTLGFVLLSVAVMLLSVIDGEFAILQGTSMLRQLAKASMWGVVAGVSISIPMFYFWRIDSIIPSILAYVVMTAVMVFVYRRKPERSVPKISLKETFSIGRGFIVLGFYMMLSTFVCMLVFYLFIAYLNNYADIETVGHYQAGYTLVNKYVGLVFTAIGMEYFPRLARVNKSTHRTNLFVTHEITIVLYVLIPIVAAFIAADDLIIRLFYADDFLVIVPFISWAIVGTVFRGVSWCMAFVILARGDGKIFLLTESISAVTSLTLNVIAYRLWGLEGLGYAYFGWYVVYAMVVWAVYHFKYRMKVEPKTILLIAISVLTGVVCTVTSTMIGWWIPAIIAVIASGCVYKRLRLMLK